MRWLILSSLCFSVESWLKTEDDIYDNVSLARILLKWHGSRVGVRKMRGSKP